MGTVCPVGIPNVRFRYMRRLEESEKGLLHITVFSPLSYVLIETVYKIYADFSSLQNAYRGR